MSKKLFVGGLPYSLTEEELKSTFEKFGTVSSCSLITDKFTNQSKGFAFVEMDNDDEADKAIKELDGTEMNGRKIVVNVAKPREDRSGGYDRNRNNSYSRNNRGGGYNR